MTPTSLISPLICCRHMLLGLPRRLTPGSAEFIILRATLFSSRLCTCTNHRRRPLRMISSIGGRFSIRFISLFRACPNLDTPRIPRSILISAEAKLLLLFLFIAQLSQPYGRTGPVNTSYTFDLRCIGIFLSYTTSVSFRGLDPAACTRRSTSWSIVPFLSIADLGYLKSVLFLKTSPFCCMYSVVSQFHKILYQLFVRVFLLSIVCDSKTDYIPKIQ